LRLEEQPRILLRDVRPLVDLSDLVEDSFEGEAGSDLKEAVLSFNFVLPELENII